MSETAVSRFLARARSHPERIALRTLAAGGAAEDRALSWGCWAEQSRRFAAALIASGHQPGEAVAILAGNTETWPVAEMGVLLAGGVAVGLYPTSAPAQVRQTVEDCAARLLVVEGAEHLDRALAAGAGTPLLVRGVAPDPAWTAWDAWMARGVAAVSVTATVGGEALTLDKGPV